MIEYKKVIQDQRLTSKLILVELAPLCSVSMLSAMHLTAMVYLGYNQDHTCTIPRKEEITQECNISWTVRDTSRYIPWNRETETLDSCTRYVLNSINCTFWSSNDTQISRNDSIIPIEKCDSWTYDTSVFTTTVFRDFDLVCDNKQKGRISQAIFMLGVLLGDSAWGQISDKYGRKTAATAALAIGVGVGIATAFSNSFTVFAVLRFFIGALIAPSAACCYVLLTEIVKEGEKVLVSQIYQAAFAVGICILSGIGYFVRDWRRLQIWISAPGVILVIWMCFILESPSWLISKKRFGKADKVIRRILTNENYHRNSEIKKLRSICVEHNVRENSIAENEMTELENRQKNDAETAGQQNRKDDNTILAVLKFPNMRKKSFILFYCWMVTSALYYGLTLNSAELGGDAFVNLFLSAVVDIPASFLAIPMMDKWGRRPTLSSTLSLSGILCICMLFVPKEVVWLNVLLSTIGKFAITATFGTVYVYTIEIYPTPVRNVGLGVCSSWARIGGIIAPFIAMLDIIGFAVPYVAFGSLAAIGGILGLLLPETLNKTIPETLQEAEQFGKHYEGIMSFLCHNRNSSTVKRNIAERDECELKTLRSC